MSIPGSAPKGFRAKAKPTKASETTTLNALQVLFDNAGVEEFGTYTHPITNEQTPVARKILVLVAMKHGDTGQYPTIRQIIAEQARSTLQHGIDPSLNRLREEPDAAIFAPTPK